MPFLGIPTSRKDLGNAGWIKGAATGGARLTANLGSVTGGNKQSVQKLRNFADAVDDPNRGYSGTLNPVTAMTRLNTGQGAFSFSGSPAGGGGGGGGGEVQGQMTADPNGVVPGGGIYAGGGGGAPEYDPDTDPTRVAEVRGRIGGLMSLFEAAFNDALGQVDRLAADKRTQFAKKYDEQRTGLQGNYTNTSRTLDDQFSARNTFNSSDRAVEQGVALDAFKTATSGLNEAQKADEASVGRFAEEQKAELRGSRPTFDVNQYGKVSDLIDIEQDVQGALNKMGVTRAGLGTDSQYVSKLNAIKPREEKGSAQLKSQLDRIANTNASPETKRMVAQMTISDAGEDEQQYLDYFERVLAGTGSGVPTNIAG